LAILAFTGPQLRKVDAEELKVLSFNVLHGGFEAEANTIATVGADIIGVQEGDNDTPAIANQLGYNYHLLPVTESGYNNAIITRFDITQTYTNGVKVDMGPLGDGYIFSVHLRAFPYEPYQLHAQWAQLGGGPQITTAAAAVTSAINSRGAKRTQVLNEIAAVVPAGAPVFLVGDFNEPSHLDWTADAGPAGAGLHTHVVPWPSSTAVVNAGFIDSYREVHPDETTQLGYTWTTQSNNPEVHDRIDFVYYKGVGVLPTNSQLVGSSSTAGSVAADILIGGYPSDHRAVLSTFDVELVGDLNHDGLVDAADYVVWRKNGGSPDGYDLWRANFGNTPGSRAVAGSSIAVGTVPEPSSFLLACMTATGSLVLLRRSHEARTGEFLVELVVTGCSKPQRQCLQPARPFLMPCSRSMPCMTRIHLRATRFGCLANRFSRSCGLSHACATLAGRNGRRTSTSLVTAETPEMRRKTRCRH
jgi:exodeoxyribonuclease III